MSGIIKINYDSDRPTASARNLWEFLDKPYTEFLKWFDKYKDYGFNENEDYKALRTKIRTAQGNEMDVADYEITVDMAKELCMLQKSEKGQQARRFFIELEKKWNSPEYVMARAVKFFDEKVKRLEAQSEADRPKVNFANSVAGSVNSILIRDLAKLIRQNGVEIGEKRLFARLREGGFLISKFGRDYNSPTQKSMDMGLMKIRETAIDHASGYSETKRTPLITGKGQQYFINRFLEEARRDTRAISCGTAGWLACRKRPSGDHSRKLQKIQRLLSCGRHGRQRQRLKKGAYI